MVLIIWRLSLIFLLLIYLPSGIFANEQVCPFKASSLSAILMDANTGKILYSQNPNFRIQPASLAKIMTLFLIFDDLDQEVVQIDEKVFISKNAAQTGGSKMYLQEDENVPLSELIKGIAVVSGNDACVAIAEWLYQDIQPFIEKMNQKIESLKLKNTKFQTVDGWPAPDQYTTASDMAILAQAYIQEHPEALQYHKLKEFSHSNILLHNRNGLIFQDPSVDGLKTGHVEAAGYHLVATAKRDNIRLLAVVMGAESIKVREAEAMQLLNFGFSNFQIVKLFNKGDVLSHVSVLKGTKDQVGLKSQDDGIVMVNINQKNHMSFSVKADNQYEAPIHINQQLGEAVIYERENIVKTIPLFANVEVQRADVKKIAIQKFEQLISKNKVVFIVSIIFILIFAFQVWHIRKLKKQIKRMNDHEAKIVKERLSEIIKSNT
jgi:D-alanyl-D-alanine carboxypeptidase (penicillin-binding protein 5/6)